MILSHSRHIFAAALVWVLLVGAHAGFAQTQRSKSLSALEKRNGEVLGGPCTTTPQISIRQELKPGQFDISLNMPIGLDVNNEGKPVSFSPDIWYRAGQLVRIGVVHSQSGSTGFWLGSGTSVCLSGDSSCSRVYQNTGVRTLVTLYQNDELHVLADGGFLVESFSPTFNSTLRTAMVIEVIKSNIKFRANPGFHLALSGREQTGLAQNVDEIHIPLDVSLMLFRPLMVGFQTGVSGPTTGFGDNFEIPFNFSTLALLNERFALGASYGFSNLIGPGEDASDFRDLQIFFNIRI